MRPMLTLGIETSCDETAAAVVVDAATIRSSIIATQFDVHARYGGIVPELACRRHTENILPVVRAALSEAEATLEEIDLIAVPALAYTAQGNRLGNGGGHYDRLLSASRARHVGLAFDAQIIEHIPTTEHDVPVDVVITEKAFYERNEP